MSNKGNAMRVQFAFALLAVYQKVSLYIQLTVTLDGCNDSAYSILQPHPGFLQIQEISFSIVQVNRPTRRK